MAAEESSHLDRTQQKAKALGVGAVATLGVMYIALGCLLPILAFVFVGVGFMYGGEAVFVAVVLPAIVILVLGLRAPRR